MSDPNRENERLREAYAAPGGDPPAGHECPSDEEIWSASRGEFTSGKATALLDHSLNCPACAESFRAAAALSAEVERGAAPATVHAFPARMRTLTLGLVAAAAAVVLLVIVPRLATDQPPAPAPASASVPVPLPANEAVDPVEATLWRVGVESDVGLTDGQRIRPGDRLYIKVRNDRPAHVYVINRDLEGVASLLFPVEGAQWSNPLPAGEELRLPGEISSEYDSWEVSSAGGRESFLILASAEPLAGIESALALMDRAAPGGGDTYLRGGETGGPEADSSARTSAEDGAEALDAALRALASPDGGSDGLYMREIILENPR